MLQFQVVTGEGNSRLLEKGAYPLMARVRVPFVVPDGDGWTSTSDDPLASKVVKEWRWNGLKSNPLSDQLRRTRAPRKQGAAMHSIKHETRDIREIVLPPTDDGTVISLGRNEAEAYRPNLNVRQTSWSTGAKYSGGQKAIKDAHKAREAYLAVPDKTKSMPTKSHLDEIRALEEEIEKVRKLLGVVKK